ncbi:universal stress protein [Hymenobacter convexus]|uniref:universal stress protein n=1 Tax=Hymenobacter sp. CA1UV-4 TaxID=3063782 RepID=UPI0027137B23|nr:universal stress protein [Hymenobacter sp. CA1UV-4]MDO7852462.1 universal stress protein [Hymenobacter sp. CA1UV-4]
MTSPALVVLTDFFADEHALVYAAGLAGHLRARLVLLHVRQDALLLPDEYPNRRSRRTERHTRAALQQLAQAQLVPTEVAIAEEWLPEALAAAALQHDPLLLVLGRPEAVPIEIVTSAALDLLRYVFCPVLVVPAGGAVTIAPCSMALAVDGDGFALANPRRLAELLDRLQAGITLLHVTHRKDPGAAAGHRVLYAVQHSGLPAQPEGRWPHVVRHPDTAAGILRGAAETKADVLGVVARRHSLLASLFHRSVTAQLVALSPLPLLLLPASAGQPG